MSNATETDRMNVNAEIISGLLQQLTEGDTIAISFEGGKRPRKVAIQSVCEAERYPSAYTSSGRVRRGHVMGGRVYFCSIRARFQFQATLQLAPVDVVSICKA